MDFGLNLFGGKYLFDYPLFINEICGAKRADSFTSASDLLTPATQLLQQGYFGIGYKREL